MRTKIVLAVLLLLSAPFVVGSQEESATPMPTTSAPSVANEQPDMAKGGDSIITFFREGHFTGSALKPSIYVDGKETDRLANGSWFSVHAQAGKHQIQSSAKNEPATVIETKPGETTYVQMIVVTGTWRGAGRLIEVDPSEAQKVIAKLRPPHE